MASNRPEPTSNDFFPPDLAESRLCAVLQKPKLGMSQVHFGTDLFRTLLLQVKSAKNFLLFFGQ